MRYLGVLGNLIFVICSVWFLIGNKKDNKKKIIQLVLDVFIISVSILIIFLIIGVDITKEEVIKSIFPTIFANNWYITCYIIFLMIVPFLNIVLENIDKKQLLRINIVCIVLYWIINFVKESFFSTNMIIFVTIFFIVAYIKKYLTELINNRKINIILLCVEIMSFILLISVTNIIGLKISFMSNKMLHWCVISNPILFLIAFSLFNLFRSIQFSNKVINLISSLTLYIYIIHENLLFRRHIRLLIWKWIYEKFTYNYIIIEALIYAILLFIVAAVISYIYKYTIKKFTNFITNKICCNKNIKDFYKKIENKILELN